MSNEQVRSLRRSENMSFFGREGTLSRQSFTQREEKDIDFRVSGLPHAVVNQAENFRVRELVEKIESHPHREALQADFQENNIYNPFSNNSKAMIREMGNVELFELCEIIPKVQCSQSLLYWNQGVIYCTFGHFLVDSESITKFYKLRLDALSVPHYVLDTAKQKNRKSTIYSLQRVKEMPQKSWLSRRTSQRYSRSFSRRRDLSWIATQNWLDRTKVHRDGRVGTARSHVPSL